MQAEVVAGEADIAKQLRVAHSTHKRDVAGACVDGEVVRRAGAGVHLARKVHIAIGRGERGACAKRDVVIEHLRAGGGDRAAVDGGAACCIGGEAGEFFAGGDAAHRAVEGGGAAVVNGERAGGAVGFQGVAEADIHAGQRGIGAQRRCAGVGLRAAGGDGVGVDLRGAAHTQRAEVGDAVSGVIAEHGVAAHGEAISPARHGALGGDGGAGERGVGAQCHCIAKGLRAAGGDRAAIDGGGAGRVSGERGQCLGDTH